ncbi:MAG: hypothetical protein L0154_16705 [Chloroflexi bacterium]|nr:hypothetical protein [Chloroflexota bacterium]
MALFNAAPPITPPPANIWTSSPATPLMQPLVFGHGYLWHPDGKNEFVYQSMTDEKTIRHGDLPGIPVRWKAIPVLDTGVFHIFWLNDRDELWHAQINQVGEFSLRPVRLAEADIIDFDAAPLGAGGAVIVWQNRQQFAQPLLYNILDITGRPRFPLEILPDATFFAVASAGETVHLAWTAALSTEVRQREYTLEQLQQREFDVETVVSPITIPENRWLTDFELVTTEDETAVIYGTQSTDAPEVVDYQFLARTGAQPLNVGAQVLRWLNKSGNSVTVAALIDGQWQAGIIGFSADGQARLRTVGEVAVDASPVSFWENEDRQWNAGWATLEGDEMVYAVVSNWHEKETQNEPRNLSVIWLSALWVVVGLAVGAVKIDWNIDQKRIILLIAYWSTKSITAIWWLDEQSWQAGVGLVIISILAAASWYFARQRYYIYFGVDAVLTVLWVLLT